MTMMYTHNENINEIINEFMNIFIKKHKNFSNYEDYEERRKKITIKREISNYVRININNKKSVTKINNFKKKINDFYVYYNINMLNDSDKAEFIYRMLHNNDFTTIYDVKYHDILLNRNNNIINNSNDNNNIVNNYNVVNYDNGELYFINGMYYKNYNNQLIFDPINGMYYKLLYTVY